MASAPELLPSGWLALEIGQGQAEAVTGLLNEAGAKEVTVHEDLAGIPRVLAAYFSASGADHPDGGPS